MKRRIVLALVALAIAGLAACGGDDDGDGAISKQEFVAQANQICTTGNLQLERRAEQFFSSLELPKGQEEPGPAEEERFGTEVVIPGIQRQVDQVDALGRPEGDEEVIDEIVDKANRGLDQMRSDPSLAASEEPVPVLDDAGNQLGEYGATECAE